MNSTPNDLTNSTSAVINSLGRRYLGMPTASMPAGTGSISYTVGRNPNRARSCAAAKPAGPEPMIAIFSPFVLSGGFCSERNRSNAAQFLAA